MARGLITKRSVDRVEPDAGADRFLWDTDVRGFGLKITSTGAKSYVLQYRMGGRTFPTRRYTIGKHGSPWTPEQARKEAIRLLEDVRRGRDPLEADKARQRLNVELSFESYLSRFLEAYGKLNWGRNTYASAESNLRRYVLPTLGRKALPEIGRHDIVKVMDALPSTKPALARSVFAHTRRLFSWALERGDVERSPFDGLNSPPPVASRERVLTDAEIRLVWIATKKLDDRYGSMLRLLMLLGA